jgi:hypothetical protein
MAIVINGSGTVTGISVGGLPDGIVDAGTLATNSVDSAELIDGSIDTAHIGTDQITGAILPAGSLLQVVSVSAARGLTFTSTSWITTGTTATITPSSTSSKILVKYNSGLGYCDTANASFQTFFTIYRDSTNIAENTTYGCSGGYQGGTSFGDDFGWTVGFEKLDSPSTTSAITYTIYCRQNASSYTQIMDYRGESTITLMEIAG